MAYDNEISLQMAGKSQNEALARMCIAGFISTLNPTIDELNDIKTAVSEAVTNAIIHGYENKGGEVVMNCKLKNKTVYIEVIDKGIGILDIEQAKTPLYTSKPEAERSGMGFTVMETFMDELNVTSINKIGTKIIMSKTLSDSM